MTNEDFKSLYTVIFIVLLIMLIITVLEVLQKEAEAVEVEDVVADNIITIREVAIEEVKAEEQSVLTDDERFVLAALAHLEARGDGVEGMAAVVEVVLNRLESGKFPCNVHEVVFAPKQFSPAHLIYNTTPCEEAYEAVDLIFQGGSVLEGTPLFFAIHSIAPSKMARGLVKVDEVGGHTFYEQNN